MVLGPEYLAPAHRNRQAIVGASPLSSPRTYLHFLLTLPCLDFAKAACVEPLISEDIISATMPDPSSSNGATYDYTEGASPLDIQQAIADANRSKRDLQYGEDGDTMFDGPGHSVNPSSVSRMTLRDHARRSSNFSRGSISRKRSEDSVGRSEQGWTRSRSRRDSVDTRDETENADWSDHELSGNEGEGGEPSRPRGRRRKSSSSPVAARGSVFENIANIFGRGVPQTESPTRSRRPSMSSRTSRSRLLRRHGRSRSDVGSDYAVSYVSEDDGEERWGYSSNEEDSDSETEEMDVASIMSLAHSESDLEIASHPPSPGPTLPLLSGDPIFGSEARIEMGGLEPLPPPPSGPPSRQTLYIADEDAHIRVIGYEPIPWKQRLWWLSCICTFGILGLLGRWFPRLWLRWVTRERAFVAIKNGFVVVEVGFLDNHLCYA